MLVLWKASFASAAAARLGLSACTTGTIGTTTGTASRGVDDTCASCLTVTGPLPLLLLVVRVLVMAPPRVVRRRGPGAAATPLISSLDRLLWLVVEAIACPAPSLLFSTVLCGDLSSSWPVVVCSWRAGDRVVEAACLLRVLFAGRARAVSPCIINCGGCVMRVV